MDAADPDRTWSAGEIEMHGLRAAEEDFSLLRVRLKADRCLHGVFVRIGSFALGRFQFCLWSKLFTRDGPDVRLVQIIIG